MKYNKKTFNIGICTTFIVTITITLGVLFGLQWMPKGGIFSFETLGVFLGAVGSVGAIFAIWLTTRKQLDKQKEMQRQNVQISVEQNELQGQIVEISVEQKEIQKQGLDISREQKEIQKQNVKLALLERRISIFTTVRKFISDVIGDEAFDNENLQQFLRNSREVKLFFAADVTDYVDIIYAKGLLMQRIGKSLKGHSADRDKLLLQEDEIMDWFIAQLEESVKKFDRYINVEKLGL